MKLSKELQIFETRIGYSFKQPVYLINALTHSSLSSGTRSDNERLEFLGDRVLGLVMAQALLENDEGAHEGQLAPRFNALVRKEACADVARQIDLGDVLKLGRSEMLSGGRKKEALLADALEALIAAVFLDGGLSAARGLILQLWGDRIENVDTDARDAKTILQEYAQARKQPPPKYTETGRSGPDHAPEFTIEVALQTGEVAIATAGNKRQAEQAAAKELLESLNT